MNRGLGILPSNEAFNRAWELVSPLGFALGAIFLERHEKCVSTSTKTQILIDLQRKSFRAKLSGLSAVFSCFARNGMTSIGQAPPEKKLEQLHALCAKFDDC